MRLLLVSLFATSACAKPFVPSEDVDAGERTHAVEIHASPKLTSIESSMVDGLGRPVRVACVTCHGVRDAGPGFPESASSLQAFHAGLTVQHGALACGACHAARVGGTPMLHLADGTEVGTADAMRLCAQCHGPKYQDYLHGSHGGMNGYWDLSRGPRLRNHCVDCHDPHVPKFQPSRPVLPPKDRFMNSPEDAGPHG
ncbi:MAG: hypothetical protein U0270_27395 [Labilithrix sp.]